LEDRAKEFLGNPNNLPNLPEKVATEIPLLGTVDVSKGVISLRNDRGTSYDMYLQVQNELTAAIKEMRDDLSTAHFGKKFADRCYKRTPEESYERLYRQIRKLTKAKEDQIRKFLG
jgi:hypothetical protein